MTRTYCRAAAALLLAALLLPAAAGAAINRDEALRSFQDFYARAAAEAGEDRFRFGPEELNDFNNLYNQSAEAGLYTGPGYGKSWATLWGEYRNYILRRFEPTLSAGGRGGDLDRDGDGRRDEPTPEEPAPGDGMAEESFDSDPGWDGRNNRNAAIEPRRILQDFGYSPTANAGGRPGEIGGLVTPAGEPAYYGKPIAEASLGETLTASGRISFGERAGGNTLVGFFNDGTINEWRTPNTIGFRFYGRGDGIMVELGYCTGRWRAGATIFQGVSGNLFPAAGTHEWSLSYDPATGRITGLFDGQELVVALAEGHQGDQTLFNRFGILNVVKSADGGGELWLDDVSVNGRLHRFDSDPGWEGNNNRSEYLSPEVRFRFDFGYNPTAGALGGLIYRGDDRSAGKLAYYGAPLDALTLDRPLRASGTISLVRAHSDSSVLFGFFHSEGSMRQGTSRTSIPENFLGVAVEGPSREGFFFYPVFGSDSEGEYVYGGYQGSPRIYPNGVPREWTMEYSPEGSGRLTITLDGVSKTMELTAAARAAGAAFDRFGIVTTHIDGNGQELYLDDLRFTATQRTTLAGAR